MHERLNSEPNPVPECAGDPSEKFKAVAHKAALACVSTDDIAKCCKVLMDYIGDEVSQFWGFLAIKQLVRGPATRNITMLADEKLFV